MQWPSGIINPLNHNLNYLIVGIADKDLLFVLIVVVCKLRVRAAWLAWLEFGDRLTNTVHYAVTRRTTIKTNAYKSHCFFFF